MAYPVVFLTNTHFPKRLYAYHMLERDLPDQKAGLIKISFNSQVLAIGAMHRPRQTHDAEMNVLLATNKFMSGVLKLKRPLRQGAIYEQDNWVFSLSKHGRVDLEGAMKREILPRGSDKPQPETPIDLIPILQSDTTRILQAQFFTG